MTSFQNDTFWASFFEKLKSPPGSPLDRVENFIDMVGDIIHDFKFNKGAVRSNSLILQLETQINIFFDNFSNYKFNDREIEKLTELCRKVNEDKTLSQIREEALLQRKPDESIGGKPPTTLNKKGAYQKIPDPFDKHLVFGKNLLPKGVQPIQEVTEYETLENDKDQYQSKFKLRTEPDSQNLNESQQQNQHEAKEAEQENRISTEEEKELEKKKEEEKIAKIKEEFDQLFDKILYEFNEHRIEDAYEAKEKVEEFIDENSSHSELKEHFEAKFTAHEKILSDVNLWYKEVQSVLNILQENEGFIEDKSKKSYKLKYKLTPDWKAILKMEGPLDIPLFNLLSLMYETDGFNHWVPFCKQAKHIKQLHRAAHAYWLKYSLPIIPDRDCYCYGIGVDRLDRNGSVMLISKKIHDNPSFLEHYGITIPKSKGARMDIDVAVELIPLSKDKVRMTLVTTVNPGVKNVPLSIFGWISRKAGQSMFERLVKKAKNLKGTIWEKQIKENREFYGWLERKVDNFLKEHNL